MPFEWATGNCMKRLYMRLQQAGVPIKKINVDEACMHCGKGECQQKHVESSLELTMAERKTLDSGCASVDEILEARQEALKREWKKEDRNRLLRSERK